jgi:hypothetical protein
MFEQESTAPCVAQVIVDMARIEPRGPSQATMSTFALAGDAEDVVVDSISSLPAHCCRESFFTKDANPGARLAQREEDNRSSTHLHEGGVHEDSHMQALAGDLRGRQVKAATSSCEASCYHCPRVGNVHAREQRIRAVGGFGMWAPPAQQYEGELAPGPIASSHPEHFWVN